MAYSVIYTLQGQGKFLQPMDRPEVAETSAWQLSLQTHKRIGLR